jgi:MoaA/NifB/PqqE/SkfB family radical SAM enzyme
VKSFFAKIFKNRDHRQKLLQVIQIEVSSLCNLKCTFCPTTYLRYPERAGLFPLSLYKKLIPYFPWTYWVYLQGWGEPLYHPELWQMVSLAKQQGVKVGLTTNGTLFHEKNLDQIFQSGIDLISFSIAGASPATHNKIRVNSDLNCILKSIETIVQRREKLNSNLPVIKLSYMLTRQTVAELPQAINIASILGVDELYATNLDYVFNEGIYNDKIFSVKPNPLYQEYISQGEKLAHKRKLAFRSYPLVIKEQLPTCELNPSSFIFITSNGDVVPCTYLGRLQNPRYNQDGLQIIPIKSFGNLQDDSLEAIWSKEDYQNFRRKFLVRQEAYEKLIATLTYSEPSLIKFQRANEEYENTLKNNPVPKECETSPKIFGV